MLHGSTALASALLLVATTVSLPAQAKPKWDFVFVIDNSISMNNSRCGTLRTGSDIDNIRAGLLKFMSDLSTKTNVDAQFAIVVFAGGNNCSRASPAPAILQKFTTKPADITAAFTRIRMGGPREAGLEAVRMALGTATVGFQAPLQFRKDAFVNVVVAADEDSDSPFHAANRANTGQTNREPPSNGPSDPNWKSKGWADEITTTAKAVVGKGAFLNVVVNTKDTPTAYQYGDPASTVFVGKKLDRGATYNKLKANGFDGSLQAQVLKMSNNDLVAAAFDVSDPKFAEKMFAAKFEEVQCPCKNKGAVTAAGAGWRASGPVPSLGLGANQRPSVCANIDFVISRSTGRSTGACILFADALKPWKPFNDGTVYLDRQRMVGVGLMLNSASTKYPVTIPCIGVRVCGWSIYAQAVYIDPVNLGKIAYTGAIKLTIGN